MTAKKYGGPTKNVAGKHAKAEVLPDRLCRATLPGPVNEARAFNDYGKKQKPCVEDPNTAIVMCDCPTCQKYVLGGVH